jgi:predicted nucleic acid-binding protein
MLDRVWELRDNLSAHDAAYVALAEAPECPLVTGDVRICRAPGLRCAVTVLPG